MKMKPALFLSRLRTCLNPATPAIRSSTPPSQCIGAGPRPPRPQFRSVTSCCCLPRTLHPSAAHRPRCFPPRTIPCRAAPLCRRPTGPRCPRLCAQVKLAQRADGELFAIKCLNRNRLEMAAQSGRLAKEIKLLKLLNHPNVIRLHEVLHTASEILMVMEYVDGGDLLEVLNSRTRFTEVEVRHIFCQICAGVSFCHSLGVAHRDLKPENILIGKRNAEGQFDQVKVADFGLSTLMRTDEMLSTACGSPHYVAPEILTFDGSAQYDGLLSDVWSLGVMLHVMLLYKLPFEAESTQLLYKKIRLGLPALPPSLPPAAVSLLQGMLMVDPAKRMTLVQVVQHEWPQLPAAAPLAFSQTVDAVVDYPPLASPNGSVDFLSASNLFMRRNSYGTENLAPNGSQEGSTEDARGGGGGGGAGPSTGYVSVRRAFTFDVLPQANDENCEDSLFWPKDPAPAVSRRGGPAAPLTNFVGRKAPRSRGPPPASPRSSPMNSPLGSPREMHIPTFALTPRATGSAGDSRGGGGDSGGTSGGEGPALTSRSSSSSGSGGGSDAILYGVALDAATPTAAAVDIGG